MGQELSTVIYHGPFLDTTLIVKNTTKQYLFSLLVFICGEFAQSINSSKTLLSDKNHSCDIITKYK